MLTVFRTGFYFIPDIKHHSLLIKQYTSLMHSFIHSFFHLFFHLFILPNWYMHSSMYSFNIDITRYFTYEFIFVWQILLLMFTILIHISYVHARYNEIKGVLYTGFFFPGLEPVRAWKPLETIEFSDLGGAQRVRF